MAGTLEIKRIYSAGIYARLSVDSHNDKNDSIETQFEIARSFMKYQPDMVLFDSYADLGKTGTNFERPEFQRLMADIRRKQVNCVIVKDFSRLGRNYIETGNLIEKLFPELGARFISVTDHFDSIREEQDKLCMNLKNLTNEMYARDIAIKIKTSKQAQRENGGFLGGIPSYGLRVEKSNGIQCLLAEETTGVIVKKIFQLYDSGMEIGEIIEWLYHRKIHRPGDRRKYGHAYWQEGEPLAKWPRETVKRILLNPVYAGGLMQTEAAISRELFERTKARLEQCGKYGAIRGTGKYAPPPEDIFRGILFCSGCGKRMERSSSIKETRSGEKKRTTAYFCRNSSQRSADGCKSRYIPFDTLLALVKQALKQEFLLSGLKVKLLTEINKEEMENRQRLLIKEDGVLKGSVVDKKQKAGELYLQYRKGKCSRAEFTNRKAEYEKEIRFLEKQRDEGEHKLREEQLAMKRRNREIRNLLRFNDGFQPDREFLTALIKKITVYPDKHVEITFNFSGKEIVESGNEGKSR